MFQRFPMRAAMLALALAGAAGLSVEAPAPARAAVAAPAAAQSFATPEDAVAALVDALRHNDQPALRAVLGPGSEKLISSGDPIADANARASFLAKYDASHAIAAEGDQRVLKVGPDNWPLPLPLVQADGKWHFDSVLGAQQIVDRRIGRNEISAIRTALACVDAQKLYFALAGEHGEARYAQRLVSSPGKHDGLYWPAAGDEPESPLAPLVAEAIGEGYPGEIVSGKPVPYLGYHFRILTGQGEDAQGGAMNYLSGGHMTKGFALIAWPASYGASGIMTFIVNQDGVVFQKDLGPETAKTVRTIKLFDPDLSWARVDVVNQ